MTVTETWTIASEHLGRRWWRVQVHDSMATMRDAAYRLHPWHGRAIWNTAAACCQGVDERYSSKDDFTAPQWPPNRYAGLIRLVDDYLYPEVIWHEVLHAACSTYRMNVARSVELGDECGEREEDLAYIYGQLAADMDSALRNRIKVA